ncbi:MAG: arginyltransferase [Caulobacteraceae bacterium]
MTKPFPTKNLRFFLTAPSPCPYLPGRKERKVFTALDGLDATALHDVLTNAGFRRSQNIAYRPSCDACDACISARVPVGQFTFTRRWRKIMLRNADLTRSLRPAQATEEQFELLRQYLASRHAEGGMAEMTFTDFAAMVEESAVHTHIVEYRHSSGGKRGALAAVALVDALGDGLSMVYSFFDPEESRRSLGVYTILDHIQQARAAGYGYLYLGYWIPGSDKMHYKAEFRPLELLLGGEWRPYEPVEF